MAKKKRTIENNDRYIEIGLNVGFYRRRKGITQENLAEMIGLSREFLSAIEAPNIAQSFSLETLFSIADALEIEPYKLLQIRD